MTRLFSIAAATLALSAATSNAFAATRAAHQGEKAPPANVADHTNAGPDYSTGAWSDPTRMQVYVYGHGLEWVTVDGRKDLGD